jgi:hypothetical protein
LSNMRPKAASFSSVWFFSFLSFPIPYLSITISTRLFFLRPSGVSFVAMGLNSP